MDAEIQLGRAAHFSRLEALLTTADPSHVTNAVTAAFSPDGTRILTATERGTAQVWSQGRDGVWKAGRLGGDHRPFTSAAFSPDGSRAVTSSNDGTTRVWSQGDDGAWIGVVLLDRQEGVTSSSFSPDGTRAS